MGGAKGMNGMFAYLNDNTTMISKTLDDFLPVFDNIGFIKVDCEGMDWKVIEGGRKTIELFGYPPILFENWPREMIHNIRVGSMSPSSERMRGIQISGEC